MQLDWQPSPPPPSSRPSPLQNNDGCCEDGKVGPYYVNDANDLAALGFSGVKLDNCVSVVWFAHRPTSASA